jgi:cyclase
MLTSIDNEGTKNGFDINLSKFVNESITVPVISSGGCGKLEHITELLNQTKLSAISVASILHYNMFSIDQIKNAAK